MTELRPQPFQKIQTKTISLNSIIQPCILIHFKNKIVQTSKLSLRLILIFHSQYSTVGVSSLLLYTVQYGTRSNGVEKIIFLNSS